MKRVASRLLLALVASTLLLTGCSPIDAGTITAKEYHPSYTYITMQCVSYDPKTFVCTIYVPITNYVPDRWHFDLVAWVDNEQKTGYVYVSEAVFNYYNVGDFFNASPKDGVNWLAQKGQ